MKNSHAIEAAVAAGWEYSSAGGGRLDLGPILVVLLGEAARAEEVRRKAGDRGEVLPPVPCKEPKDVRLRNVGVIGRSLPPRETELGARRRWAFWE